MSFKREGNDPGLLKKLQHKRVSEILGNFIPDDEALLLSNGRLTCTICPKRPIFDTMQMLSLHRKGKNHLYELSCYLQKKRDSEYGKSKQIQERFLLTGWFSAPSTNAKTETSLAFMPRSLTQKNKTSGDGKFVFDISETCKIKSNVTAPVIIEKSANSQVRHYLKSLSRKRPLEKTVKVQRSRYPDWQTDKTEKIQASCGQRSQSSSGSRHGVNKVSEAQLRILESGWVKDSTGKWMKDPNVEFDSDEEPPT